MWYLLYREMAALCLIVSFLIVLEDWPKPTWTNLAFWTDAAVCLDAWIQFLLAWWGKRRGLLVAGMRSITAESMGVHHRGVHGSPSPGVHGSPSPREGASLGDGLRGDGRPVDCAGAGEAGALTHLCAVSWWMTNVARCGHLLAVLLYVFRGTHNYICDKLTWEMRPASDIILYGVHGLYCILDTLVAARPMRFLHVTATIRFLASYWLLCSFRAWHLREELRLMAWDPEKKNPMMLVVPVTGAGAVQLFLVFLSQLRLLACKPAPSKEEDGNSARLMETAA
ncbi:unnamed protein product [Darwinula stevensoni]|uniref:Uncharacterized protein n=1 Tax=Darwinula stevensoni TaxID=69355 RepID=A0A7R9A6I2_9CRUS|nr:unnamed protein product [Darwinula stevensoni]CAG0887877.1 unnamed protein product [Darwinula stevensoni]